jgi:nitrogen-specific signal transduction histidine kinase
MNLFEAFFIFVYIANIVLGIGVFSTNNKRAVNQHYLSLSVIVALWLTSNWLILHAGNETDAEFFIKLATALAILIPASCHLLRLTILYPYDRWWKTVFRAKRLLGFCLIIIALCFSPVFIDSVKMPLDDTSSPGVPEPIYNLGYFIFAATFVGLVLSLLLTFAKDRKRVEGLQRIELDFITIGYCAALITGTLCGVMVTIFTGSSQTVPMANTSSILALTSILSYGIATRRILGIATILRRIAAYSILSLYLVIVYLIIWYVASLVLTKLGIDSPLPSQILATLVVALTMAPMHGKLQKASDKLIASKALNISDTMKKAGNIFQSVTTQNALLDHFSLLLLNSLRAEHIIILLQERAGFRQHYPRPIKRGLSPIPHDASVIDLIEKRREPICEDSLIRVRETRITKRARQELSDHGANIAIGIFAKSNLAGIVLLGSRMDGLIYDKNEQDALQILCNQFAVALENAQMYTQMQDSKIRNDIMLDQLVSGVIVANTERKITLINHEAQRITGLTEGQALGQDLGLLPKILSKALENTLATRSGTSNTPAVLFAQEEEKSMHVRMGSAYLMGHDDKPMGALLVFTDMTELKSLEEQVRRTDQLSSVGTLAAGMAHEIKNPLVTIKTFAQLLPERHGDADFRHDFSSLVAHEVERIDDIVNQLLSFSKPSQPHLVPMKLHDTIEKNLKLMHEQLSQRHIALTHNLRAKQDLISGDADLLTQTLVNLNLNASEAIENEGAITVTTTNCAYRFVQDDNPDNPIKKNCIRLQVRDTGRGIPRDHLHKIFDPFFTSKSEGTGMGLSVTHGIIQEHQGVIEVDSEPGKGTVFSVYIPLLKEDATA